jgi:hypothetical protein
MKKTFRIETSKDGNLWERATGMSCLSKERLRGALDALTLLPVVRPRVRAVCEQTLDVYIDLI